MAQKAKKTQRSWTPGRKARQAANWLKSQKRKQERLEAQKVAEKRNRNLTALGLPTPWEKSKLQRRKKRSGI